MTLELPSIQTSVPLHRGKYTPWGPNAAYTLVIWSNTIKKKIEMDEGIQKVLQTSTYKY